jgi:hypothetical protein
MEACEGIFEIRVQEDWHCWKELRQRKVRNKAVEWQVLLRTELEALRGRDQG